jgi:hypothetical protein
MHARVCVCGGGGTARAGSNGLAVSIFTDDDRSGRGRAGVKYGQAGDPHAVSMPWIPLRHVCVLMCVGEGGG